MSAPDVPPPFLPGGRDVTWCDNCADAIAPGAGCFVESLRVPVESAGVGESASLCRACFERVRPLDVPPPFLPDGDSGLVVVDTRAGLDHFRLLQVIGALSIEAATGMRHGRGSVLNLARDRYGVQSRTKRGALRELRQLYRDTYGRECSIGARLD